RKAEIQRAAVRSILSLRHTTFGAVVAEQSGETCVKRNRSRDAGPMLTGKPQSLPLKQQSSGPGILRPPVGNLATDVSDVGSALSQQGADPARRLALCGCGSNHLSVCLG